MFTRFDEAVHNYLQQLTNIHNLDQWSKDVLYYAHMGTADAYGDREKYGWDHKYVYHKLFRKVVDLIKKESPIAFNNILRFHELEYTLYILQSKYPEQKEYIKKVEGEMNLLFEYIKKFMTTIIRTRLDDDNPSLYKDRFSREDYEKVVNESGRGEFNFSNCYKLLMNAKALKEKIYAVQASLHTYHDNGKIFGVSSNEKDDAYYYAPFTSEQFDRFHVDADKIEQELEQELGV